MEEEITKSSDIITEVLLNKKYFYWDLSYSLLVHTSIINKIENALHETMTNTDWEMCEHILQIGSERYEMHLINVLRANKDQESLVRALVIDSQFSFPWEENPTLFISAAEFHNLKEFIQRYNLEAYILKIEEKLGYSVNGDHPIKVVSFNQSVSVKLDIINEFQNWRNGNTQSYLFVTNGFPWQHFDLLRKIRLNDNIYSVLPIILRHLGTLSYANDLNIFDLLSLKLAISDARDDPSNSNLLIYEIDFMIKRILAKIIKNKHLSIKNYFIVKNIQPTGLLMFYLVYEFQHLFQTLDVDINFTLHLIKSFPIRDTIKLKEEFEVLNKLKERSNVKYYIDGRGFDNMSLSLFVDLIQLRNVYEIVLDTNYRWCNNVCISKHNRIIPGYETNSVHIYLEGKNTFNFIEGFTAELKTITLDNRNIILNINCNLNDYRIFDNLNVINIRFRKIKIDLNMLQNLQECNIKPPISLYECSLESTSRNWELLNNLENFDLVNINEDEGTWLSMFEFILEEIHKSNTNEFQFKSKSVFTIMEPRPLFCFMRLNSFKFAIDDQKSKLEIRRPYTNEVVDLYCEKFGIGQEEPDYEFYQ